MALLPDLPESQLRTRTSAKWTSHPPEVIPLTVAEMDFALAAPIAEALHAAIARSDTGYIGNTDQLAEAYARFVARRWAWQIDPGAVLPVGDVSVGVVEALRLCTRPGDKVAISPPVHPPFTQWAAETRTEIIAAPLTRDSNNSGTSRESWTLDLDAIEHAFRAGARAYLLCHPHNPLGRVHTRDELATLARLAARYGVTVLADEIYAPLTLPGTEFVPYLHTSPEAAHTGIAVWSTGKAWNIAGLKCATLITAHPDTTRLLHRLPAETRMRTAHLGVLAHAR